MLNKTYKKECKEYDGADDEQNFELAKGLQGTNLFPDGKSEKNCLNCFKLKTRKKLFKFLI